MKIAIVGAGISGLVAAYHLKSNHDVTVYEANPYIGGHTNTVDVESNGQTVAVDTGFIVFNDRTYPNFVELLNRLNVASQPTQMSFSLKCEKTGLEYRGADFDGLFAQRRNILNLKFLGMLRDCLRFNRVADELLQSEEESETVDSFLRRNRFGEYFIQNYFLPMGSAVWSCPLEKFGQFPIRFVAGFYDNHGLLGLRDRPQWRVIKGGSKQYVNKLVASFREQIHLSSPVDSAVRKFDSVELSVAGSVERFDHVIFACHSDQALRILGNEATQTERDILGNFPYEPNRVVLHTDDSVLPKSRRAWASWNYFKPRDSHKATLTYNMNILQSIEHPEPGTKKQFCVTLNDEENIDPSRVIRQFDYAHPTFSLNRLKSQRRHHEINGSNRTSFCGAYWGNGFHEDGVNSALQVIKQLTSETSCEAVYTKA